MTIINNNSNNNPLSSDSSKKTKIGQQSQSVISADPDNGKPKPKCQQYHAACRDANEDESICTKTANHQGQHRCGKCNWDF